MATKNVVLAGFLDQPNLGLGYLAAMLAERGYRVKILDFRLGPEAILDRVVRTDPLLVGLSLIYQYYAPEFGELVSSLRAAGVRCLICVGGHYPSLRPRDVLCAMPGVDCIVRFEGEHTLVELADRLEAGRPWVDLPSLAVPDNGQVRLTPLRPLIQDLDALPFPVRPPPETNHILGVAATTLLASRGCPCDCSFCSIRRFYSTPPGGPLRRTRSPENVVREMVALHGDGIRVFLFQDDDFSLSSRKGRLWAQELAAGLRREGLAKSIIWKISCRADEVQPDILSELMESGLAIVYLGLESGNPTGLRVLNKRITVARNLEAVDTLKELGLRYDFGFMLFDPTSTIDLVLENVRFLRRICGDGSSAIPFCKTLPYGDTRIEDELRLQGRLCGDAFSPDYGFSEDNVDAWFAFLQHALRPWAFGSESLLGTLRWARSEVTVLQRFFPESSGLEQYAGEIRTLAARYNDALCRIVEDSAPVFAGRAEDRVVLERIREDARAEHSSLETHLLQTRLSFFERVRFPVHLVAGLRTEARDKDQQPALAIA